MRNKNNSFYKEHSAQVKALDDPTITEEELIYNKVYTTSAYAVFRIMREYLIKRYWKDSKGYPLMEKFYSKNILVCSISIRKLAKATGFGTKKVQRLIKQLEEAGWIIVSKIKVKDGQKVYILGYWSNDNNNYKQYLFNQNPQLNTYKNESKFDGIYNEYDRPVRSKQPQRLGQNNHIILE